ncbi:C69 family dipeptidase [Allofustis seminis]|uniref:C69 family dipeptidase n=1 Tax=Allofustis seminis TaxID=166939 RepID=UPI00035D3B27|nr:C69 family dipeptidase [Allofustis seminis]
MACTTILVGKNASYDGSTLVARNEDTPAGIYCPKRFTVMKAEDQPRIYRSVLSKVEIPLPDNPLQYTYTPNALNDEGIWGAFGVNALNISMTATETLTANERLLAADPLVIYEKAQGELGMDTYRPEKIGGIGEEDIVTLVLPYIRSAKEGALRLGALLEKYGTYEMNGIAFQDVNDIWWLETIGGHHWYAKRVPDDHYVIMPNQLGVDYFDFNDAYGEQKEHLCSADLKDFIENHHLNTSMTTGDIINPRLIFGTASDADHTYNTPRAWVIQRYLNPHEHIWDGEKATYRPWSDDIPWSKKPERKITSEDIKYILSNHYQNTPYDPYSHSAPEHLKGSLRAIGINRTSAVGLVQLRPYLPEECMALEWVTYSSNPFNTLVPFYANVDRTPEYLANTTRRVTTENYYWINRIICALADPVYHECSAHIERYQIETVIQSRRIIEAYDAKIQKNLSNAKALCEEANEKIAQMLKEQTEDLLDKVLIESSNAMKNAFSRSDA